MTLAVKVLPPALCWSRFYLILSLAETCRLRLKRLHGRQRRTCIPILSVLVLPLTPATLVSISHPQVHVNHHGYAPYMGLVLGRGQLCSSAARARDTRVIRIFSRVDYSAAKYDLSTGYFVQSSTS